ncbi:hypothetical protein OROHE_006870 [Orobanche hederae]
MIVILQRYGSEFRLLQPCTRPDSRKSDAAMGLVLSAANVRGWTTGSDMEGPPVPRDLVLILLFTGWNFVKLGELRRILELEELVWKLKSRADWLELVDKNTKYFHQRTMLRRKRNEIAALNIVGDEWNFDNDELKAAVVGLFK